MSSHLYRRLSSLAVVCALAGCAEPRIEFREVHRIDERLDRNDLERLYKIAGIMPDGRLPAMAQHFVPRPNWDTERPATVATLAGEEVNRLRETTGLEVLGESLRKNSRLDYALKREGMTRDQYVGLVLSIGLSMQRHLLDPTRDLELYKEVGRDRVRKLRMENASFAAMQKEEQIDRIEQATWITRLDRAQRLLEVPEENVTLVATEATVLEKVLPKQFLTDPLLGLNDPLIDFGVPFRETAKTGFDAELMWDRKSRESIINGRSRDQAEMRSGAEQMPTSL